MTERGIRWVVALAPLCFLTVRGWINAALILLALLVAFDLVTNRQRESVRWTALHWMMFASFLAPVATEALAQAFRGTFSATAFDGPSRFLLAGLVFAGATRIDLHAALVRYAWVVPAALLLCLAAYFLDPEASANWGGRAATYFVDTITFGIHVAILTIIAAVCFCRASGVASRVLSGAATAAGAFLLVASQSRSGWVSFIVTSVLLGMLLLRRQVALALVAATALGVALVYASHDATRTRVLDAVTETAEYFSGSARDTSTGIRISLVRLDVHLFLANPLSGMQDGVLPPLEELRRTERYLTEDAYEMKRLSGSHTELTAQIVRRGVWGFVSFAGTMILPMVLFLRYIRHPSVAVRWPAMLGAIFTVGSFVAGLFVQTLNLKFTSSYTGLMLAVLASQVLRNRH